MQYKTVFQGAFIVALLFSTPMNFAKANDMEMAKINITGTGTVDIAPDMAIVTMGVTREAKTAREALDANTQGMAKVFDAMKSAGIAERDLQTSNFSIQPNYRYNKSDSASPSAPVIEGYIVRNSLTVRIRDLTKVGDVLDASVTLGVNDGGNIRFTNDDPSTAISEARTKAMKDAIAKATTLSEAANVTLGDIMEITEGSRNDDPQPLLRARSVQMAAESVPVPIAAGENTYSVSVNVTFGIKQ